MTTKWTASPELQLASEILRPLISENAAEVVADDGQTLRFRVRRHPGWKLTNILLDREALRHLLRDPQRMVKVEYLQRDIERSLATRREFRYPHAQRVRRPLLTRIFAFGR